MKHLTDNPDVSIVPQPYRDVIQRALRKDPAKRFRNVAEMLDALHILWQPAGSGAAVVAAAADRPAPEMVFGPVQHHEIVPAEIVSPNRTGPRPQTPPHVSRPAAPAAPRPAGLPASVRGMNGSTKALLVVAVILALHANPGLVPLAAVLAVGFVAYLGIRKLTGAAPQTPPPVAVPRPSPPRQDSGAILAAARARLRNKPLSEHVSELTGSMLSSALVAALLCLAILLIDGRVLDGTNAGWATFAWLASVSTLGAWNLLLLGKFWEAGAGDQLRRRATLLVAGLVLGTIAYGLGYLLLLDLPHEQHWNILGLSSSHWLARKFGPFSGPLAAYQIFFAGLFAVLRWWRPVDPLRRVRLSMGSTVVCLLWAWVMNSVCDLPQPWGFFVAAAISVAVQVAAPWLAPAQRVALVQQPQEV